MAASTKFRDNVIQFYVLREWHAVQLLLCLHFFHYWASFDYNKGPRYLMECLRDFQICDGHFNENATSKNIFAQLFVIISSLSCRTMWASDFRAKIKNERFTFERSLCRQNLKFGDFTSLLCRAPHEYLLKCVPHVQHDYFPSFNQ